MLERALSAEEEGLREPVMLGIAAFRMTRSAGKCSARQNTTVGKCSAGDDINC
jgi:hypothetical protein